MPVALDEEHFVENDFLRKLLELGWRVYRQDIYNPEIVTEISSFDENLNPINSGIERFRESFSDVILKDELHSSLKRINPFLEKDQIEEVIRRLEIPDANSFVEINREFHELLTLNTSVSENRLTHEKSPTVRYIDFSNLENNSFIAISQFKVQIPGTENHIIPDIVLFVNGIPLVVVECKSPSITDPISEAINQLMRYSERRNLKEGNQKLFRYNLFQIATAKYLTKFGTITSNEEYFTDWKDPYPFSIKDLGSKHSNQDVLIQGMLSKKNFLDIMHTYTIFRDDAKGTTKVVARYHQFRAVKKLIEQLRTGKTPLEKGGIIWHTQGSGKSLTMMFTVRELYHHQEEFGKYKAVFITDRVNLQKQLTDTSKSVGFTVKVANSIRELKELLKTNTPELVMGMISKFQETEFQEKFPLLNTSPNILLMIDEAHRSEYKELGANLHYSLPNSVKIAFTGTPIDKTEITFGDYIDKYTLKQSVNDGVTVPIYYEGRAHEAEISNKEAMNRKFEDVFKLVNTDEKKLLMSKYSWRAYLEDKDVIRDKAKDIIEHYVTSIFINGFKAQVVTASRLAAVRFKEALEASLKEKIEELKINNPYKVDVNKLKKVKVTTIISGTLNDAPEFKQYTNPDKQEKEIKSFKLPFDYEKDGLTGDVGIIVVQSMLITGFDAPIEQVMYLDNVIKQHNLLQAIARVNRVYKNKNCGYVIDYVGVFNHIKEALSNYYEKDVNEILSNVTDKEHAKDKLAFTHNKIIEFFSIIGIRNYAEQAHECIDLLLADEKRRNEFYSFVNEFNRFMDIVLPDPYALKFKDALRTTNFIRETLRSILNQGISIKDASSKIREIVENYLISKGIRIKIEEVDILNPYFLEHLGAFKTPREKATATEISIRRYISDHYPEDPELYKRFADKLEETLKKYKENWEVILQELYNLREDIAQGRGKEKDIGLDKQKEMPFFGILVQEIYEKKNYEELSEEEIDLLKSITKRILSLIEEEINIVDFWENDTKQRNLRSQINLHLITINQPAFQGISESKQKFLKQSLKDKRSSIAQRILETAYRVYGASHGKR